MIELVEMEIREELTACGFDGDIASVIPGSALCEIENKQPEIGREAILKLMEAVDADIPVPERNLDEPLLMPIENLYKIPGRGTVISGNVERGVANKGDKVPYSRTTKVVDL